MTCICPTCRQAVADAPVNFDAVSGIVVYGDEVADLTAMEADYYSCFSATWPRPVTRDFLREWVYWADPDGGPDPKNFEVIICHMRRKLRPLGMNIENIRTRGWRLVYPEAA